MKRLILASMLLASAAQADCVAVFGDSISATNPGIYPGGSWVAIMASQRPDLQTCNVSTNGWTTAAGLAWFDPYMDYIQSVHEVTDVVVMLGVNDRISGLTTDPMATALRLRQIAAKIRQRGAREWLMKPTPATYVTAPDLQDFTNEVGEWLDILNGAGPEVYTVIDPRDVVMRQRLWNGADCFGDSLHPTGLPCRQAIAAFVASVVPQQ